MGSIQTKSFMPCAPILCYAMLLTDDQIRKKINMLCVIELQYLVSQ